MYTKISDAVLKTGEKIEFGVLITPDKEYRDKIIPLLGHKGQPWVWQMEESFNGKSLELENRFYIGTIDGKIVSNITIVEHNNIGIFTHVYTVPEHRKKGICNLLIEITMSDCRKRGCKVLTLQVGYGTSAYKIYYNAGFRSLTEGSGCMRLDFVPDVEKKCFEQIQANVRSAQWKDWPTAVFLYSIQNKAYVRNYKYELLGPSIFERGFLEMSKEMETDKSIDMKILESERSSVAGVATVCPDEKWGSKTYLLDIFYHPDFVSSASKLLDSIIFPKAKVQCYLDSNSEDRIKLIEKYGFKQEGIFKKHITYNQKPIDVLIFSKIS